MAKHRAESETTLTGTVATRGLLTAVAALAVAGGPAAGMALADEADAPSTAAQESYNGADGANGHDGADGANGKDVHDDGRLHAKDHPGQAKHERRDQDGKDGKDGQRGEDGKDAAASSLTLPAMGADGLTGTQSPSLGGVSNPFTGVLGNDVGV